MTAKKHRTYPAKLPPGYLAPRYWGIWLGLGLSTLLGHLPRVLRRGLGRQLGKWVYRHKHKRRDIASLNVDWCFKHWPATRRENLVRDNFLYQGAAMADTGRYWWCSRECFASNFRIQGEEHLAAAMSNGGRVIMVTLHTHGMDLGGLALSARWPMVTYVNRMRNPLVEWIVAGRRGRFGGGVFTREEGMRPVIRALRAGRIFYYPVDEDAHRGEGEFAPFFGVAKYTHTAPFRLARISKAKIIPCATYYSEQERRYIVQILPGLDGLPSGDHAADAARLNAAFEELVMLAPEQYTWGQRLFQTRPDGKRLY